MVLIKLELNKSNGMNMQRLIDAVKDNLIKGLELNDLSEYKISKDEDAMVMRVGRKTYLILTETCLPSSSYRTITTKYGKGEMTADTKVYQDIVDQLKTEGYTTSFSETEFSKLIKVTKESVKDYMEKKNKKGQLIEARIELVIKNKNIRAVIANHWEEQKIGGTAVGCYLEEL